MGRFLLLLSAIAIAYSLAGCSKFGPEKLRDAVLQGDTNMLSLFVRSGGDPNAPMPKIGQRGTERLIHLAAERGKSDVVSLLLACGADVNATNSAGESAIMCVVDAGEDEEHSRTFHLLMERHADISMVDGRGQNVLTRASACRQKNYVASLLKAGADPNYRDRNLNTPLHLARTGEIVMLLVEAGAEVNPTNNSGQTPLDVAEVSPSSQGVIEELRRHGGVNQKQAATKRRAGPP